MSVPPNQGPAVPLDDVTRSVSEMYAKFPYPSPQAGGAKLKELVNLLKLFSMENRYDLAGKTVLDAGTGTGHRLIEAAAAFKNTRFMAIDICEPPLALARQTAAERGLENVEFRLFNLMDDAQVLGKFDVVLSMGVIHHLSDPAIGLRNLVHNMADDGICFLYIYGRHGSRERLRRKAIVSLLLQGNRKDFERGIDLVKQLGFDSFDYGWNLNVDDEKSRDALIVDAYLNVNENLYDTDSLFELVRSSGLHRFVAYGVTLDKHGYLFESRLDQGARLNVKTTDPTTLLGGPAAREAYNQLTLADRYRVIDLLFQPNGYTLIGFKEGAVRHFPENGRILANTLSVKDLQGRALTAAVRQS